MNLKIFKTIFLFSIFFIYSCNLQNTNNIKDIPKKIIKKIEIKKEEKEIKKDFPLYIIEDPYFIEGIEYIPKENYQYIEYGLASYYDKELHKKRTINNEFNNVTELFARHKTLPIPSVVKITNLENGLSINVRVNDRGPHDNKRIIEVSRKVAQLLRFYKKKSAKVRVEILSDESKQIKIVMQSISNPDFEKTINSAPVEDVNITDLGESDNNNNNLQNNFEQPILLEIEQLSNKKLYIKTGPFESYEESKKIKENLNINDYKNTVEKDNDSYSVIFGPLSNDEADNLFQILLSKGYNNTEFIIQ